MEVKEASTSYEIVADDFSLPGYKRTEAGIVPEDWKICELGEICLFENGDRSSNYPSQSDFRSSGIPFINAGHVSGGKINVALMDYIRPASYNRLTRGRVKGKDILYCLRGSLGKFGMVPEDFGDGAIASSLVIVRSKAKVANLPYLLCYFGSPLCSKMIETWAGGAAQPNLGVQDLARFLVPLPSAFAEQEAIAETLSDTDALIESLEQLIAKRREIKQGIMQTLLTGKQRLPGFKKPWKVGMLGSLGTFLKGRGVARDQAATGDLACIRYGEIYTKHNDYIKVFNSWISQDVASSATRLVHGDLLFAGSGETKEEIGKCVAFVGSEEAYAGGDIVILRSSGNDPKFLGYYLNTAVICARKASKGQGDAVVHIGAEALGSIEIEIPEIEEQSAIATILTDMDTELAELETRLAKTRQLKQGMMQALLTGRIRLPLDAVA